MIEDILFIISMILVFVGVSGLTVVLVTTFIHPQEERIIITITPAPSEITIKH